MLRSVTVYCASSRKTPAKYLKMAAELAETLLAHNIGLVYGGGAVGLMGHMADIYVAQGGEIEGIIPEFMVKVEWAHPGVDNMHIVQNMAERKEKLMNNSDAIIALPGGTGTLEELVEVLALKRLGKYLKPIVIVNMDGFYDELLALFEKMVQEKFLRKEHLKAYTVVEHPSEVIEAIRSTPNWDENAISKAPV